MTNDHKIKAVGARIRAAREAKGATLPGGKLSQEAMALALGKTQSAVGKWEATGGITIKSLHDVADYLGTTASELMGGTAPADVPRDPGEPLNTDALAMALTAFADAGGNDRKDLSSSQHARAIAVLYQLAAEMVADGNTGEDVESILAGDVDRVIRIVRLDGPARP
ncbi:helix-turn-helix domain-containing protein [Pyruvatibacter sp.]